MRETRVTRLPQRWVRAAFGDCAKFINGRAYGQNELLDSGTPVLRIQNLSGGDRWYYSDLSLPEEKYCNSGDLLFAWSASFGPYIWKGPRSIFHYHIWRVLPNEKLNKKFAFYLLDHLTQELKMSARGIAMLHLTKAGIETHEIALPPLDEQLRIAAILDQADDLRRKRREALGRLKELNRSIFLDMFGDPVQNRRGWPVSRLGAVGTLDRGVSKHRPRNDPALLGGAYPLIQTGGIANCDGYVRRYTATYSELGLKQSKLWPVGTLCITIAANIGKTGILTFDACFPDSVVGFTPNDLVESEFVQQWFAFIQPTLEKDAPQFAQKNINLAILRDLVLPIPPLALQRAFAERIVEIDALKSDHHAHLAKLDALYSSLQHRAFRGEL